MLKLMYFLTTSTSILRTSLSTNLSTSPTQILIKDDRDDNSNDLSGHFDKKFAF